MEPEEDGDKEKSVSQDPLGRDVCDSYVFHFGVQYNVVYLLLSKNTVFDFTI